MYEIWRVSGVSKPNICEVHETFHDAMQGLHELTGHYTDMVWEEPHDGQLIRKMKIRGFTYWISKKST